MTDNSKCVLCHPELMPEQKIILSNEKCIFYQIPQSILIGSGIIVPRAHKENVFELSQDEWNYTFSILNEVKELLDKKHKPDGYNIFWNTGKSGGQHLMHAHLHVVPRFLDEPLSSKDLLSFIRKEENRRANIERIEHE